MTCSCILIEIYIDQVSILFIYDIYNIINLITSMNINIRLFLLDIKD